MSDIKLVLVTFPADDMKTSLFAKVLIKEKLGACVNRIKNMESYYEWDGKLNIDTEDQLIIKTTEAQLPALKEYIRLNHPYDLPEMIVLDVVDGSEDYMNWVRGNTGG